MENVDRKKIDSLLTPLALVDALKDGFQAGCEMPRRVKHSWGRTKEKDAAFLMMPAWRTDDVLAVKLTSVVPGNSHRGLPSVQPIVILFHPVTGAPFCIMDGEAITLHRTAATSALASLYLSRTDARKLLVMGTGSLAPYLARAHRAVRPIDEIFIWGRNPEKAKVVVDMLRLEGMDATVALSAESAVRDADIISCATLSVDPLVFGNWVSPGTHVDLVGAFLPDMRESDDSLIAKCRLFVDDREASLTEAGDIIQPIERGVIEQSDLCGDLRELVSKNVMGRTSESDCTLFKSVGLGIEDFIAAKLVYETLHGKQNQ